MFYSISGENKKGDFQDSHKKTDRAFKNSRAMNHRILHFFLKEKKKKAHYGSQEDTGIPYGIG